VEVFEASFPGCPVLLLGEPLPDRPDLPAWSDPRQGPAVALRHWAAAPQPAVERWWVVACDQVRWTPRALEAWHRKAASADPASAHWVLANHGGRTQFLGGWLAGSLRPALAALRTASLWSLSEALPCLLLEETGAEWQDVDTPEALSAWLDPKAPG
jgi:molybdopterin-guanine dinucleotide biosynthesis protein A